MRTLKLSLAGTVIFALLGGIGSLALAQSSPTVTREPVPSEGCGTSDATPGQTRATMLVGDLERAWWLDVPPAHDGRTPIPLVVNLHGYSDSARAVVDTRMGPYGEEMGFATVSPEGRGSIQRWLFELDRPAIDITTANPDVAFIEALLDRLSAELCIDLARVYVTGFSNGGWLASALSCTLSGRIAAVAPVGGVLDLGEACRPERTVPMIAFFGTADPILPYEGGFGEGFQTWPTDADVPFGELPMVEDPMWAEPIAERVAAIAARNGCEAGPTTESMAQEADRMGWACLPGGDVEFIVIRGGGHAWPGTAFDPAMTEVLGYATKGIDATPLIWDFFAAHPLP